MPVSTGRFGQLLGVRLTATSPDEPDLSQLSEGELNQQSEECRVGNPNIRDFRHL